MPALLLFPWMLWRSYMLPFRCAIAVVQLEVERETTGNDKEEEAKRERTLLFENVDS